MPQLTNPALASAPKYWLEDEWIRMHRFARTARTETIRTHCERRKLDIERELHARAKGDKT